MRWDPVTTLRRTLWIGGAQWAGKSTVAGILAERHGLTHYHYDYHDARGHQDRWIAGRLRRGEPIAGPDPESWVRATPEELAEESLARFRERFAWVLDDLRALASPRPLLAEGWGLRPDLIAPVTESLRRVVVLMPSAEFARRQVHDLPRAAFRLPVGDPQRARRNRDERNRLLAEDVLRQAKRLNVRVFEVDGTADAETVADRVAQYWQPFLVR